ncbi:MAG: CapA family protein, partial [Clostridia bacterium]|nr:CapA family protein [Clostridia bacterium]
MDKNKIMTMTAVGDVILNRGLPEGGYPGFETVRDFIARGQARIGNLETTVTELDTFAGCHSGGMWHTTSPRTLRQIASFGFNLMSFANNHTLDFGHNGILETLRHVREQTDISLAGAGASLQEASDAVFRDLPAGRVAFIAVSSSFCDEARAGDPTGMLPGRPGLNPLRSVQHFEVNREHFDALSEIAASTAINGQRDRSRANGFLRPLPEGTLDFGGTFFKLSEDGVERKVNHPHPQDMKRILAAIEDAKLIADYVVIMVHTHQIERDEMCYPDHFIREFSRAVI